MLFRSADQTILAVVGRLIGHNAQRQGDLEETFALMIGMDRGYLAGIETGKYNATFDKLADIADGFGITLSELLAGVDDRPQQS